MSVFEQMRAYGHEQVVFCSEPAVGLRAIIAIHDTTLGPALGGVRMWNYRTEEEALQDVLRLSRAMTYKAALAGLRLGGGKAVILGDPRTEKSEGLFRAFGRFCGEPRRTLHHRRRRGHNRGGYGVDSPGDALRDGRGGQEWRSLTSDGVRGVLWHESLRAGWSTGRIPLLDAPSPCKEQATWRAIWWRILCAKVLQCTLPTSSRRRSSACGRSWATPSPAVDPEAIYDVECDIFSPNALGGTLNERTIPRLRCRIVAGGANNQLQDEHADALRLHERGILYAPDYVINAGGLINVAAELEGEYDRERAYSGALRDLHHAAAGVPVGAGAESTAHGGGCRTCPQDTAVDEHGIATDAQAAEGGR
jgi:leucine dehydrogenase